MDPILTGECTTAMQMNTVNTEMETRQQRKTPEFTTGQIVILSPRKLHDFALHSNILSSFY